MKENASFIAFDWKNGYQYNDLNSEHPTRLFMLVGENTFDFRPDSTYFVYVFAGLAYINSTYPLLPEYYAQCTHKDCYIFGNEYCKAIIVERVGTEASFLLGGPIEDKGRLKYIDGCTDSLLIAPWKYGQPCLNHLHFPAGIDQTAHTHPSIRIGIVARGNGECVTPFGNIPLTEGMVFAILPHETFAADTAEGSIEGLLNKYGLDGKGYPVGTHAFRTFDGTMDVIAYHPDSDFGPTDEEHPMINRTIVEGKSAKWIDEIRTK